jgi:Tol biopolymer transport system component
MQRKVMFKSIRMSKAQLSIYVLILLPLLVPCEVFAGSQTKLVSVSSTGVQGNDESRNSSISSDGRYVAFDSNASNLVDNDSNGFTDIFVHERQSALIIRVSVSSTGEQVYGGSFNPSISSDGRHIAFHSGASDIVTGDSNSVTDIFMHGRLPVYLPCVPLILLGDW